MDIDNFLFDRRKSSVINLKYQKNFLDNHSELLEDNF